MKTQENRGFPIHKLLAAVSTPNKQKISLIKHIIRKQRKRGQSIFLQHQRILASLYMLTVWACLARISFFCLCLWKWQVRTRRVLKEKGGGKRKMDLLSHWCHVDGVGETPLHPNSSVHCLSLWLEEGLHLLPNKQYISLDMAVEWC